MPIPQSNLEFAGWVLACLCSVYGRPEAQPRNDPLGELIGTVLSQHTSDVNSGRAFGSLQAAFHSWEAVRDADPARLQSVIREGGLAVVKAARIQAILDALTDGQGKVRLPDLRALGAANARAFLTRLPGVGKKTASCVLLFAVGLPAIPVDTHVHRVAGRLGLIPARASADDACEILEASVPPEDHYAFHISLIRHGREVCRARTPLCAVCVLRERCEYANA